MKYPYNFITPTGMIDPDKFGIIRAFVAIFKQMKNSLIILFSLLCFSGIKGQDISVSMPVVESGDTLVEVLVPFYVSGLDGTTGGIPVSAMEFYVYYDNTIVDYVNAINFYSGAPAAQWVFGTTGSRFGSNWVHPQLLTLNIPDNTKLFDVVFYYKKAATATLNISETECVLVDGTFQQIPNSSINYEDGAIVYSGFIAPPPGLVEIVPDEFISFPDSTFHVPVNISGFGMENSSLSNLSLYLNFDNNIISYQTATNFSTVLPSDQWTIVYEPANSRMVCSWNEPAMQNVQIPDNTTLFELVFKGENPGVSPLTFDDVSSVFIHQHNGQPVAISSNFGNAEVEIFGVPNPPPGLVGFNPDLYVMYRDSLINVPVFMSGFSTGNSSLSDFELSINIDQNFLEYQIISEFDALLPAGEWEISYNSTSGTLTCSWNQPLGENLVIPENTKLFEITLKALLPGNTTLSFDASSCLYHHQFMGYTLNFSATYNTAQVQIYDWTIPLPGLVEILPDYFQVYPDTLVHVPVVISGFGQENSSLSDMELYLDFDPIILNYQTVTSFTTILPEDQWNITFDPGQSRMVCVWNEPSDINVPVPENTTLFELVFKAAALGSSTLEFDSANCVFIHQLIGSQQQITANFENALVEVVPVPLPSPGLVEIVPDTFITNPDSVINVPIVVSGFGADNSSLSDMELVLEFNSSVLEYQEAGNFNVLLPSDEWNIVFDAGQNRMVCTWNEVNTENVSIPDNSTLFELVFKAVATGQSTMHFDSVACWFIHQINGTNQYTTSNFNDALVTVENVPPPPPGLVAIVPDYFSSNPDSAFYVPVVISGFSQNNSSLADLELVLDFDNDIIGYEMATAFDPLFPEQEWSITYQPASGRITCVWSAPSGENLIIPENTTLFELVFSGLQVGVSPLEFDSTNCFFYHQQGTGQMQLSANFGNATVEISEPTIPSACKVKIIPDIIQQISGTIINVPVVFFGFNNDTTTLAAAEFYLEFDTAVMKYQGVTNFNALMPQSQWIYNIIQPDSNRFACNWVEPTLSNLSIPDSTTVFELQFLLLADETPLAFDDAANVFVHFDQEFNPVEIPVDFYDGYIIVLWDDIAESETEGLSIKVVDRRIILEDTEGLMRVFNLAGQLVVQKELTLGTNEVTIPNTGIYLISVINHHRQTYSGKVFIR